MFYATAMICWLSIGCLLATSPTNPYSDKAVCKTEAVRMHDSLSSPPWFPYGPPDELTAKCLSEPDYKHMLEPGDN